MLARFVRWLAETLVRVFYPDPTVEHRERLPAGGPVIFVLNHPNGLLDPLVLAASAGRRVRFMAKSTLFGNPFGRLAMKAFGCVPVYRGEDLAKIAAAEGKPAPGLKTRGAANEATFARCRAILAEGDALALFPEGVSHSDPQLKPLKSGAARIALSAEREAGGKLGLQVVPVGLAYEAKTRFRSRVLLVVGEAIPIAPRLAASGDDRGAADQLTLDMRAALDEVVLQAESRDLLEGVARVAAWTAPAPAQDLGEQHRRARELLTAYQVLSQRAPDQVEPIVRSARDYARVLRRLGIRDPWALELERVRPATALGAVARLIVAAPFALVGGVLGLIPFRFTRRMAPRMTTDEDLVGTMKLVGGAFFHTLFWLLAAVAVGIVAGPLWGVATFVAAPLCGYVALRFDELFADTVESARHQWLRATRPGNVVRLAERRRALAEDVARAVREVGMGGGPAAAQGRE